MVSAVKSDNIPLILEAAQKQFARYGFKKTTMNDIADEIGMSKASLYYYFPNKEELFKEVIKEELAEFIDKINTIISTGKSYIDLLVSYAEMRHVYFQNFINLGKLSSEALKNVKPLYTELFKDFKKEEALLAERMLQKGVDNGELEGLDIPRYAELYVNMIQGLRKNVFMSEDLADFTDDDYEALKKQSILTAKIFGIGIKTKL